MALMFNPKSPDQILKSMLERVSQSHPDVDLYPGALAYTILQALSFEVGDYYNLLSVANTMSAIATAEGPYLDMIGALTGCRRNSSGDFPASTTDYILSLPSGLTGEDFGGSLAVPAGTRITTDPLLGEVVVYQTTEEAFFGFDDSSVSVAIEAVVPGPGSNLDSNSLTRVLFANAPLVGSNPTPIANGAPAESDENYRFRITKQLRVLEGGNLMAVRLAALAVPGVVDVIIKPYAKGPGSFALYVVSNDFSEDSPVLRRVEDAVEEVKGGGTTAIILSPTAKRVRLGINLMFSERGRFVDQATKLTVIAAVKEHFANMMPESPLVLSEIESVVEIALPDLRRVNVSHVEIDGRVALLKDHTLFWDEQWLLTGVDVA